MSRSTAVGLVTLGAVLGLPAASYAASPSPSASASPSATPARGSVVPGAVVPGAVAQAAVGAPGAAGPDDAQAETPTVVPPSAVLVTLAKQQQQALAASLAKLTAARAAATAALQTYQAAQRAADAATRSAQGEAQQAARARARTDAAQQLLNSYVGDLYRTGLTDSGMLIYLSALDADSSRDFFGGLGLADRVGTAEGAAVVNLAEAQSAQEHASAAAAAAAKLQLDRTEKAAAAKAAADALVASVDSEVAAGNVALTATQGALGIAQQRDELLARADLVAHARTAVPTAALRGAASVRADATCKGGDIAGYPNGMLPVAALCPLWGTGGHLLRADAAAAFNAMSHEYAATFGAPICVTDSYRSFAVQVTLKAQKPVLAAVPGTSNHGWGVATDLCDGVEQFGTVTHNWLLANSMRFGWFHPAWAEPTGSKPEPWHWEYAG